MELEGIFSNFNGTFCKLTMKIMFRHRAMRCLADLHCLPMSYKVSLFPFSRGLASTNFISSESVFL